jgi:hypothetical protein
MAHAIVSGRISGWKNVVNQLIVAETLKHTFPCVGARCPADRDTLVGGVGQGKRYMATGFFG